MARLSLRETLMRRDDLTSIEVDKLISEVIEDLRVRIAHDDISYDDICEEYFGLEPDYLEELLEEM